MKFLLQSSDFLPRCSELYDDVNSLRDDLLSYPLDAFEVELKIRSRIALDLKYILEDLADVLFAFECVTRDINRLYERVENIGLIPFNNENK